MWLSGNHKLTGSGRDSPRFARSGRGGSLAPLHFRECGNVAKTTLSQNGRFSTKKSGQFRGLTKDALLHSHVNRVTFSLTSTLPMANPGCPVCSHRGGMAGRSAWRCKVIVDNALRRCRPPPIPCFRWRCGGGP